VPACSYFAYGSNLHPARLGRRCPSARLLGTGTLVGWRLAFRKRGQDGSAKGDAVRTGRPEDCLWVAAYELSGADKRTLDATEGLGGGYSEETIRTTVQGVEREGCLYVAQPAAVDANLAPFDWYRAMVELGAAFHGFPEPYLAGLRAFSAVPDPDVRRAAQQWQIVAEIVSSRQVGGGGRSRTIPTG